MYAPHTASITTHVSAASFPWDAALKRGVEAHVLACPLLSDPMQEILPHMSLYSARMVSKHTMDTFLPPAAVPDTHKKGDTHLLAEENSIHSISSNRIRP